MKESLHFKGKHRTDKLVFCCALCLHFIWRWDGRVARMRSPGGKEKPPLLYNTRSALHSDDHKSMHLNSDEKWKKYRV